MSNGAPGSNNAKNAIYALYFVIAFICIAPPSYIMLRSCIIELDRRCANFFWQELNRQSAGSKVSANTYNVPIKNYESFNAPVHPSTAPVDQSNTQVEPTQTTTNTVSTAELESEERQLNQADDDYTRGHYADAERLYRKIDDNDPNTLMGDIARHKLSALLAQQQQRAQRQNIYYTEQYGSNQGGASTGNLAEQSEAYAASQNRLGDEYLNAGRLNAARAAYSRAVSTAPLSTDGKYANDRIEQIDAQLGSSEPGR